MLDNNLINIIDPTKATLQKGPEATFSGVVNFTMLVSGEDPSNMSAGYVCFDCCAKSAWHTHPKGQLLVVGR